MVKAIVGFFDRLEDHVRGLLSHKPIVYAIIGGVSHVLFWRGVWHIADDYGMGSWTSLIVGIVVLMLTGLIVSAFIGDQIIISGIRNEKKLAEKTEEEVEEESSRLLVAQHELREISKRLSVIEKKLGER